MKRNGDFLRTFFHAALVSCFQADMAVMATELGYSMDALKQAKECQDDETASTLFEHLTQYCLRKDLSMDALLYAAVFNDLSLDRLDVLSHYMPVVLISRPQTGIEFNSSARFMVFYAAAAFML